VTAVSHNMLKRDITRQVSIIHLSDVHFGEHHTFTPERTATGDRPPEADFPSLAGTLARDLASSIHNCPVLLCITGDFAEIAAYEEFAKAEKFLTELLSKPLLGKKLHKNDVFFVPGNHDVVFDNPNVGARFQQYADFNRRFYGEDIPSDNPWAYCKVHNRIKTHGAVIATLNSSIYVQKGQPDQDRGHLDTKQLTLLEEQLSSMDREELRNAIKIALVHHHPVLIPQLVEPRRGYDAIHNSGALLSILKEFGFHAVLHGHKHTPYTFTDDVKAAFTKTSETPIFLSCAGSLSSKKLSRDPGLTNCYNHLTIKWHPAGNQFRVKCVVRGLATHNEKRVELLPSRWDWFDMRIVDRTFIDEDNVVKLDKSALRKFDPRTDQEDDKNRAEMYARTRGNLPVVQVRPSLIPNQAYEAIVWIVQHPDKPGRPGAESPVEVIWSAGPQFEEVIQVTGERQPNFATSFDYWGPMLVQAKMIFDDRSVSFAHVYAHLPVGDVFTR
jgi:3',5'-cyclic AMP phosphodiesterase CpdA